MWGKENDPMRGVDRIYAASLGFVHPGHLERYIFAGTRLSGRVLDAACGCGYGTHILATAGCDVTGVDIEPDAIDYAKKHWPGSVYEIMDLNHGVPRGTFDSVVSFETLEHLETPQVALEGFWGISKRMICSVPNEVHYRFKKEKFWRDKYPHRRHYTPLEFDELLGCSGWNVIGRFCQETKISPVIPGVWGIFLIYECCHG